MSSSIRIFFFVSSRRRHTRWNCDWSSDVCSSDLVWRNGLRLLNYGGNTPIKPADFSSPGGMITVVPDGYEEDFNALAKATCIIIKFGPNELEFTTGSSPVPGKVVQNWTVDNIVAYSKICTHVGCPAANRW